MAHSPVDDLPDTSRPALGNHVSKDALALVAGALGPLALRHDLHIGLLVFGHPRHGVVGIPVVSSQLARS
jgi:hypothetical protein